jgi:hypothetical protein
MQESPSRPLLCLCEKATRMARATTDLDTEGIPSTDDAVVVIPKTTWEVLIQRLKRVNTQWPSRDVHFVLRILGQYDVTPPSGERQDTTTR